VTTQDRREHGPAAPRRGWVEVIAAGMFAGKTEELMRRVRRATLAKQPVQVFTAADDTRAAASGELVSHDARRMAATPVAWAHAWHAAVRPATRVVALDEAQFVRGAVADVAEALARAGARVIVAGLDMDYRGEPFEGMARLLAVAEHVTKLAAICARCGGEAHRSQRLVPSADRVLVGAADAYEARCRACHEVPR